MIILLNLLNQIILKLKFNNKKVMINKKIKKMLKIIILLKKNKRNFIKKIILNYSNK